MLFKRQILYHLANTFLPTISLVVIVEVTLFFEASKLDLSVTLSLTIMLVMYTLYQSISVTIPKTAYLKLIDYWLIFCLLTPFLIFIIETAWYLEENKKEVAKANVRINGCVGIGKTKFIWTKKLLLQIFITSLTVLFILCYFAYVMYLYCLP